MSRYYYLTLLVVVFFASGCVLKSTQTKSLLHQPENIKILDNNLTANFSKEDKLILYALDAYERGKFKQSSKYFATLYDLTAETNYAAEAIKSAVIAKDYNSIKTLLSKVIKNKHNDPTLNRYLVAYYIDKKMHKKAKKLADELIKDNRDSKNLELAGLVYERLNNPKKALKLYKEAYQLDKDQYALLKMSEVLYFKLEQTPRAIRLLETHSSLHGCTQLICTKLVQFYSEKNDIQGVERTLKRLYKKSKNLKIAQQLLQLYATNKSYDKAIAFLKETKLDDMLLLDVYMTKKDYKSALKLADRLYKENNDPTLLARSAILEYESAHSKNSKKLLKSVSEKFDKVIEIVKDPLYYNFYAYLLIDHDIDIDKGIELIKKALKDDPNSNYYIDTLAWGLYKKGDCQKAYELLEPISKDSQEKEILEHLKAVKKCLEGKNR